MPLHPAFVHFPIALIVLSVIAEFVGYYRGSQAARTVAWWALLGALLGGVITIGAGYLDMWRASLGEETHELVHQHLKTGWVLAGCLTVLTLWRGIARWMNRAARRSIEHGGDPSSAAAAAAGPGTVRIPARHRVGRPYLLASVLVMLLTLFQGWYGAEMAYAYGAGGAAAGQGMQPKEEAQARLEPVYEFLQKIPGMSGHDEGEHQHSGPAAEANDQSHGANSADVREPQPAEGSQAPAQGEGDDGHSGHKH